MDTSHLREVDVKRNWISIDASKYVLGRLASEVAIILQGKHKPEYSFHTDYNIKIYSLLRFVNFLLQLLT